MLSKRKTRVAAGVLTGAMLLALLSGCTLSTSAEDETAAAITSALSEVNSCETSIVFEMVARIGATSSSNGHTASIGSDISITSVFEPFSCHAEYYSQILVDGARTREDQEFYVTMEDEDYAMYEYQMNTDEWHRKTLTKAEIKALPLQSGLIRDWGSLFMNFRLVKEGTTVNGKNTNQFEGPIPSSYIQDLIGTSIYGSFLHSMEMLLNDTINCTLFVDTETNLPVQVILEFSDEFAVSDMIIESATIVANYSRWNESSGIEVPKKVSIVASDPEAEFYVSYFAWDLFLPYILGDTGSTPGTTPGSSSGGNVSFLSAWDTFQLRLDNYMTKVPMNYSDLKTLGYYIDNFYSSTIVEPNSVITNVPVLKNQDTIYCSFYNAGDKPQPISNCAIGCLDFVAADIVQNGVSVFLPGEVTLGITRESLIAAYGEADVLESGFAVDKYTWHGESENQSLYAEVSPNTDLVIRLKLTNIPLSSNADSAEAVQPDPAADNTGTLTDIATVAPETETPSEPTA